MTEGIKTEEKCADPVQVIQKTSLITNKQLSTIMEVDDDLGKKLGKLLLEDDDEVDRTGLVIDWLCSVELEIGNSNVQNVQVNKLSVYTTDVFPFFLL